MNKIDKIKARILIRSLKKGIIRPGGAKFIHCGHENWLSAQIEELAEIEEDHGATVHFIRGAYGEGKTHFLNYLEEIARERGWATSHVECKQDVVEIDRFETLYPKIIQKLRLEPDKLEADYEDNDDPSHKLLNLWAHSIMSDIGIKNKYVGKPFLYEEKLFNILQNTVMCRNLNSDLQRILCAFPRALLQNDYNSINDMVSWLKGHKNIIHIPGVLLSKPGQRVNSPGVDPKLVNGVTIRFITNSTSHEVFRGLLWILSKCGYKGLILSIDEVEQIARLKYQKRRDQSLQVLREFVDNTDGDSALQRIAIYFAATPNMFDDEQYFRSYDALATRIEPISNEINWRSSVINLEKTRLTKTQLLEVAIRILSIFKVAYSLNLTTKEIDIVISNIVDAVDVSKYRIAKPRLLCRSIVDQLERVHQGQSLSDANELISGTAKTLLKEKD